MQEKCEDAKMLIRNCKLADKTMAKTNKGQAFIYRTFHRILKIAQHESHKIRVRTQVLRNGKQFHANHVQAFKSTLNGDI